MSITLWRCIYAWVCYKVIQRQCSSKNLYQHHASKLLPCLAAQQHKPSLTEPVKWTWRTDINYTIVEHHVLRKIHGHKRFNWNDSRECWSCIAVEAGSSDWIQKTMKAVMAAKKRNCQRSGAVTNSAVKGPSKALRSIWLYVSSNN